MKVQFTQEVKDNWIEALESGNFTQGYGELEHIVEERENEIHYCCIGVLGHITEGLRNSGNVRGSDNPYECLAQSGLDTSVIWKLNDKFEHGKEDRPIGYKDDYSNVLELIKSLPVIEPLT